MELDVKNLIILLAYFIFFLLFNHDCIIYIDFTRIAASSSAATDDIIN